MYGRHIGIRLNPIDKPMRSSLSLRCVLFTCLRTSCIFLCGLVCFVSVLQNPRTFNRARIYVDFISSCYWFRISDFHALVAPALIARLKVRVFEKKKMAVYSVKCHLSSWRLERHRPALIFLLYLAVLPACIPGRS